MKKVILFLLAIALGATVASAQQTQAAKIAYVNSETILRELPEAQEVKKELETTIQAWQAEYQKMVKDFQDASDDYQKKQALLDPKAKDDKEKALAAQRQQILDYQTQKFDQREGEGVKLREQKFAPIQEKVLKAIEQVAKEDGFTYVFDKLETTSNLLYTDAKFDLTYKVIDRLKRGDEVPAPAKNKKVK